MSSTQSPQSSTQATPEPLVPVVVAWLVPGGGHLLLRRPWPALFVALAVLPLFVLGMYLTGWENVSFARHPYYFALQAPAGLVALVGELATRGVVPDRLMPHAAVGTLFGAVAGLLNLMAVTDVWARTQRGDPVEHGEHGEQGERREQGGTAPAAGGEEPGGA